MPALLLSAQAQRDFLRRFASRYGLWNGLLAAIATAGVAWHWAQPRQYYSGVPYSASVPMLLVANLVVNGISFYFQRRYVRSLLQRVSRAAQFQIARFALRFYLYNLAVAVGLSVVCFLPLFLTFFFFWIYPIAVWLVPYHLISGVMLGREIKHGLQALTD